MSYVLAARCRLWNGPFLYAWSASLILPSCQVLSTIMYISPQEVTYLCPCVCSSKYRSCLCAVYEAFVFLCHNVRLIEAPASCVASAIPQSPLVFSFVCMYLPSHPQGLNVFCDVLSVYCCCLPLGSYITMFCSVICRRR